MEGLDLTILKLSEVRDENPSFRVNSEYFCKDAMRAAALVAGKDNLTVSAIVDCVQHPVELTREYDESGLLIMLAQNVRDNRIEFGESAYMPTSRKVLLEPNRLKVGDVLMTRSGANYGQSAPWKYPGLEAFACADLVVFRSPRIPTGYLSTFLSSRLGKTLIERGVYGMAQPHIAPSYLLGMRVPRLGALERKIDEIVDGAITEQARASELLKVAEDTLTATLLRDWHPPEPLTYTQRASASLAAGRFDAEYFAPRVRELLDRLGASGRTVRDVAPPRHEKFDPQAPIATRSEPTVASPAPTARPMPAQGNALGHPSPNDQALKGRPKAAAAMGRPVGAEPISFTDPRALPWAGLGQAVGLGENVSGDMGAGVEAATFDYIEISDVQSDGTTSRTRLPRREAPSRATQFVRTGDVITSTVRPIRRLSALIFPEQAGSVCSSGFVVLEPRAIAPEVLLTYLRLPLVCELMDLHTSASLYPAISETDLLKLPFPNIPAKAAAKIVAAVRSAHTARQRARDLLAAAQRAVEIAIEKDEASALRSLAKNH